MASGAGGIRRTLSPNDDLIFAGAQGSARRSLSVPKGRQGSGQIRNNEPDTAEEACLFRNAGASA
jgi:hypothetical protein